MEVFKSGTVELAIKNASKRRNLIAQFAQVINKVEITMEEIRSYLNKSLTPQEAIDTLSFYIDGLCIGKERNKVGIIIK